MKKTIQIIVYSLLGLLFINSGFNKFFNYMPVPKNLPKAMMDMNDAFIKIGWLMPLTAVIEIIGGLLLLFKTTRALAVIVLFPVMVGILLTHAMGDLSGIVIPAVFFALMIGAMIDEKEKLIGLIR